jgi:hypothetical protein
LNTFDIEILSFDSEDNYKTYTIPVMSLASVPVLDELAISYNAGTTTLTVNTI